MEKFNYRISYNPERQCIILYIRYMVNNVRKNIQFEYNKLELLKLYYHQEKNDFMNYQFKYIFDNIDCLECKEILLLKKQEIRQEIIKILEGDLI